MALEHMIVRCPDCGRWLETERRGIFGRFIDGMKDATVLLADIGEDLGDKVGLSGIGKIAGGACGLAGGYTLGIDRVMKGNHYWFSCPCGWEGSTDNEECDMSEEYEKYCQEAEFVDHVREAWNIADKKSEYKKVSEDIESHIEQCSEPLFKSDLYNYLALSLYGQDKFNEALSAINLSLGIYDYGEGHAIKGMIINRITNSADVSYDALLDFTQFFKKREDTDSLRYCEFEFYVNAYLKTYGCYSKDFCSIPAEKRRYITFVEGNYVPCTENVLPLRLKDIPPKLIFPSGIPTTGVLYVSNPVKPNIYYPSDEADICIFRDQIEELKSVLACLGAKKVEFKEILSSEENYNKNRDVDVKASGRYMENTGNAQVNYHGEDDLYKKICDELNQGMTFEKGPFKPQKPEGFKWYPRMEEWKSLAYRRLEIGNVLIDKKRISSSMESTISKSKRTKVEADFNEIVVSANVAVDVQNQEIFKERRSRCWEYEVEFYPMSEYEAAIDRPKSLMPLNAMGVEEKPGEKLNWPVIILSTVVAILLIAIGVIMLV